jgi:hypothetical protein
MTTYKIEIHGQRAVDLVTALRRAGLDDLAADIDRQIHDQRAQAVRTLWMQGAPKSCKTAESQRIDKFFKSVFGGRV